MQFIEINGVKIGFRNVDEKAAPNSPEAQLWKTPAEWLPEHGEECLVTVTNDFGAEPEVIVSTFDTARGWTNIEGGDYVVAWMPLPKPYHEEGKKNPAKIEREDGRVYYIDDDGNRYVLYLLADLQDPCRRCDRWLLHDMVIAVEDEDGGRPCGFFYQEGLDDESLLDCCKRYVNKGGHLF